MPFLVLLQLRGKKGEVNNIDWREQPFLVNFNTNPCLLKNQSQTTELTVENMVFTLCPALFFPALTLVVSDLIFTIFVSTN